MKSLNVELGQDVYNLFSPVSADQLQNASGYISCELLWIHPIEVQGFLILKDIRNDRIRIVHYYSFVLSFIKYIVVSE